MWRPTDNFKSSLIPMGFLRISYRTVKLNFVIFLYLEAAQWERYRISSQKKIPQKKDQGSISGNKIFTFRKVLKVTLGIIVYSIYLRSRFKIQGNLFQRTNWGWIFFFFFFSFLFFFVKTYDGVIFASTKIHKKNVLFHKDIRNSRMK